MESLEIPTPGRFYRSPDVERKSWCQVPLACRVTNRDALFPESSLRNLSSLGRCHLLAILVVPHARGRGAIPATDSRSNTNDLAMDGARHAVLQLEVHLGNGVLLEDGGFRYITNGSRFDHVADGEALDGLVLGRASRAVGAADGLDVAAALLVAAVVLSLLHHVCGFCPAIEKKRMVMAGCLLFVVFFVSIKYFRIV